MFTALALAEDKPANMESDKLQFGAITFMERCALCHGNMGMGDGLLPLALKNYPPTDLHDEKVVVTEKSVKAYLTDDEETARHQYSPPWNEELNDRQVKALVAFTVLLKQDTDSAILLLKNINKRVRVDVSVSAGHVIYKTRCQVCHGNQGKGDGHLSKVIKMPPPFNLTLSRANDDYLYDVISLGGEKVGRSPSMPPWGDDLSESDLKSVILFINQVLKKDQKP